MITCMMIVVVFCYSWLKFHRGESLAYHNNLQVSSYSYSCQANGTKIFILYNNNDLHVEILFSVDANYFQILTLNSLGLNFNSPDCNKDNDTRSTCEVLGIVDETNKTANSLLSVSTDSAPIVDQGSQSTPSITQNIHPTSVSLHFNSLQPSVETFDGTEYVGISLSLSHSDTSVAQSNEGSSNSLFLDSYNDNNYQENSASLASITLEDASSPTYLTTSLHEFQDADFHNPISDPSLRNSNCSPVDNQSINLDNDHLSYYPTENFHRTPGISGYITTSDEKWLAG